MEEKIKISEYCKGCSFLCKSDKEYCPNRKNSYDIYRKRKLSLYKDSIDGLYKEREIKNIKE